MSYAPLRPSDHPGACLPRHRADLEKTVGFLRSLLALTVLWGACAAPALAQDKAKPAAPAAATPQSLGTFNGWIAASVGDGANKVCYMRAKPERSESRPARLRRGDVAVAVTHRPGAKQRDEVSFDAGYAIKDGAVVAVEVDAKRFQMYGRPSTDPEAAWSADEATDKALVAAMRNGITMVIRAASARGSETVDTVALAGFSRAYAEIGKACGIK
jgi:invasion protein IalB